MRGKRRTVRQYSSLDDVNEGSNNKENRAEESQTDNPFTKKYNKGSSKSGKSSKGSKQTIYNEINSLNNGKSDDDDIGEYNYDDMITDQRISKQKQNPYKEKLWYDLYVPDTETLAVHKKKIDDIRSWLRGKLKHKDAPNYRQFLLFTGPTGTGKTTTLKAIASELSCNLCNYEDPVQSSPSNNFQLEQWKRNDIVDHPSSGFHNTSSITHFCDFLRTHERFGSLMEEPDEEELSKIIVVEDLPSLVSEINYQEFRDAVLHFIRRSIHPLVFIISDSTIAPKDMYRMFPYLWRRNGVTIEIKTNPTSKTLIKKALKNLFEKVNNLEAKVSHSFMDELCTYGDIRCAISTLQLSLSGTKTLPQPGRKKQKTKKSDRNKKEITTTKAEQNKDTQNLGKKQTRTIYQSLGRLLHSKRETNIENASVALSSEFQRKPLVHDIDETLSSFQISPDYLRLYLNENYMKFSENIDTLSVTADYMSDADMINDWQNLALQNLAMIVAARGLTYANRPSNPTMSWVTLHKPSWYENERLIESNQVLLKTVFSEHDLLEDFRFPFNKMNLSTLTGPFLSSQLGESHGILYYFPELKKFSHFKSQAAKKKELNDKQNEEDDEGDGIEELHSFTPIKRGNQRGENRESKKLLYDPEDDIEDLEW